MVIYATDTKQLCMKNIQESNISYQFSRCKVKTRANKQGLYGLADGAL